MDDESYFTLRHSGVSCNVGYYTDGKKSIPENVKFSGKQKFPSRIMVCWTISRKVLVLRVLGPNTMNNVRYKNVLQKNLVPFLHKNYEDMSEFVFWPDLATFHYHKDVVGFCKDNNITMMAKDLNPPNCPQVRPIERFWAHLKSKVYDRNWTN